MVWFQTKELNEELDRWLTKDVTGQAEIELPGLKMSVKTLEEAEIRAENDRKLAKEAVALAIIYSNKDNTEEWIKAGENYEQLALEITVEGLAHSFFNTVVELETRRKKLTKGWVENACPQLVIRIGVAKEKPKHTPRRDIKEVLI